MKAVLFTSAGRKKLLLTLILAILTTNAYAISVDEIVKKATHASYYQGADGKAKIAMVISDSQGRKRTRSFTILRKDIDDATDGAQKFYVYFTKA
jgi:hypothetical protein